MTPRDTAPPASARTPPHSIVLGQVLTMDPQRPTAQAVGISHGRVVAVGSAAEVRAALPPEAAVHDFGSRTVVPGLIDSHNHMLWTGIQRKLVNLSGARSIADILALVQSYAQAHPDKEWVVAGSGWHVENLAEKRYPTRQELDRVCPDRPVYLPRVGHAGVGNTLALKLGGVMDHPATDPPGGRIVRDAQGLPTGVLLELPAFNLIERLVPPPSHEDQREALIEIQALYHATGITGVIDPGLMPQDLAVYQDVWAAGQLTVRTVAMPLAQTDDDPDRLMDKLSSWGLRTGFGDDWLRIGAIKVFLDGGASLNTALMREPYPDERCQCGIQVTHTDVFHRIVEFCARKGWSIGVHAVGGKAIDIALEVFDEVHQRHPVDHLRFSLIHAYLWPTHANMETARRLGVAVATQAPMQYQFAPLLTRRFGRGLMGKATPVKAWLDGGIVVGGGSDSPVTPYPPLLGMWHAVTRYVDDLEGPLGEDEAISPHEALSMYTTGSAWVAFAESQRGMLRPGMLGDWVVLSDNPLTCDPMEIRHLAVLATAVGGQVVFSSEGAS